MTARNRLESYLDELRSRIRAFIYMRAAAVAAVAGLALVVALVWLMNRDGFTSEFTLMGRALLALVLAVIAFTLVFLPLRRLARDSGSAELERRLPAQDGRIRTYLDAQRREQQGTHSALTELLAADAMQGDRATPVQSVIPSSRLWIGGAVVGLVAIALAALLINGPSFWGYGSRHLLLGKAVPVEAVPVRKIAVLPGDVTVRRNSDLTIRASIEGFAPDQALVMVKFDDQPDWQRAPMQSVQEGDDVRWEFRLFALRGPLQYYVTAQDRRGEERSGQHAVGVVDLPKVDRVRLTYRYPKWTDLATHTEEISRDIRAVPDTQVDVEVFASAPLESPVIVIDGNPSDMRQTSQGGTGTIDVEKPGNYHISARVLDELVALTDDYRIEIVDDRKPTIEIRKPGRDWRATSIEEVPVSVEAQDDFRLQQVELRYSVNGGKEQTRRLASGSKQADVESLLRMEELGDRKSADSALLSPGDLVSYYAVAKDRGASVETDLFVVQVQPFERRFSEGQGGGGGGSGGGEQGAISERQREILLATWNTQRAARANSRSRAQLEDSAKMLSELQVTLATQARTLAERTRARSEGEQDERIAQFIESLERAAAAMDPAAKNLEGFKLDEAIPLEQQALQQLLRAEAAFRDVQVAMQRDQSQGGGGQQASRNFTEMFELEMDVDKNHYETESRLSEQNESEELDEAVRKLKELAERQERLAQQANRSQQQTREERWRQEQLRREAEDLRRRLEELSRSQQSQSQSAQSQSSQGERGESGSPSQSALESMREALDDMRAATGSSEGGQSSGRSAAEASRNLRRALEQMEQPRGESMGEELQQLADRAQKLVKEQREVEADLYDALGDAMSSSQQRGQLPPQRSQGIAENKQRMADEVTDIHQDMRAAMDDHGARNPEATRRLSDALGELEESNLVYRLERSAAEVRYGRAREAAPREGLIAEALDTLEDNLRVVASIAANERQDAQERADPQRLLAELGELRRALREAAGNGAQQADRSSQGQQQAPGQQQDRQAASEQQGQQAQGTEQGQQQGAQPGTQGARTANNLSAWNPGLNSPPLEDGAGQFRSREAAEIAQRLEQIANRPQGLGLSASEIQMLRRMARDARGLSGRSMAERLVQVATLVERLELATLASLEREQGAPSAHTSASIPDAPQYREAVAEYYRRLGGSCTNGEGGRSC